MAAPPKGCKRKKAPSGFTLEDLDNNTGNSFGWIPIEESSFYKIFKEAIEIKKNQGINLLPRSYELTSPKINGNPENLSFPEIFRHGEEILEDFPNIKDLLLHNSEERIFAVLEEYFSNL